MKTPFVLSIILMFTICTAFAQLERVAHKNTDKPLLVGDIVPDISFKIRNYHKPEARLSDFKNKLTIIDLMNVWCGASTQSMKELRDVRAAYGDQVSLLMATKDNASLFDQFLLRSETAKTLTYPTVTGEQPLAWLFSYVAMPNYVWLDEDRKIRYITQQINPEMVGQFLRGEPVKQDERIKIDIPESEIPIIAETSPYWGNNSKLYSYLAPVDNSKYYLDIARMRFAKDKSGNVIRIFEKSATVAELYKRAYNSHDWDDHRVLLVGVPDSIIKRKWLYEMISDSEVAKNNLYDYMRVQLDMAFGISSSIRNAYQTCLVLKRLPGPYKLQTAGTKYPKNEVLDGNMYIKNTPIENAVYSLNVLANPPYEIVNQTGIDRKLRMDLVIPVDFEHLEKVNHKLAEYGLILSKERIERSVLELTKLN